jgi:hypothetical protein
MALSTGYRLSRWVPKLVNGKPLPQPEPMGRVRSYVNLRFPVKTAGVGGIRRKGCRLDVSSDRDKTKQPLTVAVKGCNEVESKGIEPSTSRMPSTYRSFFLSPKSLENMRDKKVVYKILPCCKQPSKFPLVASVYGSMENGIR